MTHQGADRFHLIYDELPWADAFGLYLLQLSIQMPRSLKPDTVRDVAELVSKRQINPGDVRALINQLIEMIESEWPVVRYGFIVDQSLGSLLPRGDDRVYGTDTLDLNAGFYVASVYRGYQIDLAAFGDERAYEISASPWLDSAVPESVHARHYVGLLGTGEVEIRESLWT